MGIFRKKINVLILGSKGMLGGELYPMLKNEASRKRSMFNIIDGLDYPDIDISKPTAVEDYLRGRIKYDYIVNCAAITDTKGIQTDENTYYKSYEVNALACRYMAEACRRQNTRLIHVSTDYVFSEKAPLNDKQRCFRRTSAEYPVNDYGIHKLVGELFIRNILKKTQYAIIRVSWLYGKNNNKSFIHKFLRNCYIKSHGTFETPVKITMTENEVSCPTNVSNLCMKIVNAMKYGLHGVMHGNDIACACGDNSDRLVQPVSRFDFAQEILANFKDDFPNVELVPVRAFVPEFGKMRYPSESYMFPDYGKLADCTMTWKDALDYFCKKNHDEIMEWLKSSKN